MEPPAQTVDKPQTISQIKLSLGFRLRRIYYISDAQCEMRIALPFSTFFKFSTFQVEFCKKILRFHANKSISQLKKGVFCRGELPDVAFSLTRFWFDYA